MIKLILLTGFLGAGKTTLLKSILDNYGNSKVGVIVNEFGKVGIDGVLLKRNGINMTELTNGSIFCACIKENFVNSLVEMSSMDIEYLFVEASGLADPSNMIQILNGIEKKTKSKLDYRGAICILDAKNFKDLYELLPAIHHQIEFSSIVIINKADLVSNEIISDLSEIIRKINAKAAILITTYCRVGIAGIVENMSLGDLHSKETTNTVDAKPKTFVLKASAGIGLAELQKVIFEISGYAYRIKGFANTMEGPFEISAVADDVRFLIWHEVIVESEIVVISSIGIRLVSVITDAIERHAKGKIYL
ncbi:MAG: GTP-binding protein [Eubacteriales bacterium]